MINDTDVLNYRQMGHKSKYPFFHPKTGDMIKTNKCWDLFRRDKDGRWTGQIQILEYLNNGNGIHFILQNNTNNTDY
jgi:hypothetical protein